MLSDLDGAGRFIDLHYDGQFHEAQDKIKRIKNRITLLAPGFKVRPRISFQKMPLIAL